MIKKFKLKRFLASVCTMLAFVMLFSLSACKTEDEGLTLNMETLTLDVGTENSPILVTSSVTEDVIWTTSDASIVTVEGSNTGNRVGLVTALKVGTATVTASTSEDSATCTVTVIEKEVITITKDGAEVTKDLALGGVDATVQLEASSSRGHDIEWSSDKPLVATVVNGLVKAVATGGTVTITATCAQHSDVSSSVTVKVGNGKDSAYTIQQGDESPQFGNPVNSNALPGTWIYWNQFNNVATATYKEGVITLKTTGIGDDPWWYNVQLFYTATSDEKLEQGKLYELTFDFDLERYTIGEDGSEVVVSAEDWTGQITVNGYVVDVKDGENHCTAYYEHKATAFSMQLGVEKRAACDITNATIVLKNIKWKVADPVQLEAPSFSIGAGNVITITDPNEKGVGSYTLNLYNESGVMVGGVLVEDGKAINTSKINKKSGTFTAQLVANAASANYITSAPSNVASNNTVTINQEHSQYTMSGGGAGTALLEPGTWTYWHESWVQFSGSVTDGVATVTFSHNTGNWYDTQLFLKIAGLNTGDKYNAVLHINNVPNKGRVTINDTVYELQTGDNAIDLKTLLGDSATSFTEGTGASITIVFGVNGESEKQEIQAATDLKVWIDGIEKVA